MGATWIQGRHGMWWQLPPVSAGALSAEQLTNPIANAKAALNYIKGRYGVVVPWPAAAVLRQQQLEMRREAVDRGGYD